MSIVEHALDWSKLAELLPQLGKEYRKLATQYRLILTVLALLPPLLIPLEAAKWFSGSPAILSIFILAYAGLAVLIFMLTGRWVENVRQYGVERIAEDELPARMLDRIERDSGKSGEMSFEEIYLMDGSGLERRTRKHIIYAENDIEVNMDRGQKLFANGNVPLQINMTIVAVFCLYTIVGSFFLASDESTAQTILMIIQETLLFLAPLAIFFIQNNFRQHLLNDVLAEELLGFITDDDAREEEATDEEIQAAAETDAEQSAMQDLDSGQQLEDNGEESVQAQA